MDYKFKAGYTKAGTAATPGSAPTINVMDVSNGSLVVSGGTPTAGTGIPGSYSYTYSGAASLDLMALFHTTDATMDQQDLHSYTSDLLTSYLDAAITSRLAVGGTVVAGTVSDKSGYNVSSGTIGLVNAGTITTNIDLIPVGTAVTDIQGVVNSIYTEMADLTDITTPLAVVDANVDLILEDTGTTLPALINTRTTLGAGAGSWTYNLKDNLGNNIADASIWVTSDIAGNTILASGITNASGNVTFFLDAGTVYVWGQKSGYNFTNPDTEVVS